MAPTYNLDCQLGFVVVGQMSFHREGNAIGYDRCQDCPFKNTILNDGSSL